MGDNVGDSPCRGSALLSEVTASGLRGSAFNPVLSREGRTLALASMVVERYLLSITAQIGRNRVVCFVNGFIPNLTLFTL